MKLYIGLLVSALQLQREQFLLFDSVTLVSGSLTKKRKKKKKREKYGLRQVIVDLWIILVPLQVLPVDEAFYPFLQVGRFYRKLQLFWTNSRQHMLGHLLTTKVKTKCL